MLLKKKKNCEINYNFYSLKVVIKVLFGKLILNLVFVVNGFWLIILLVIIVLEKW